MAKQALGRGLGALMGGISGKAPAPSEPRPPQTDPAAAPPAIPREQVRLVPVEQIKPCAFQPRKDFAGEALQELADSIREQGVLQPLTVRPAGAGFELIAGERRWRAAQLAGLKEVPVLVRDADDRKVLELALIENLQRENLNPIEEALGYSKLISDFSLTQEEAAVRVGKKRVTVANLLRLLQLAPEVQGYVRSALLSFGHARAILGIATPELQKQLAEEVIRDGLSVRETEQLVSDRSRLSAPVVHSVQSNGAAKPAVLPDVHLVALQGKLQERLGTKVSLKYRKGKGTVEIRFFNDDDLERIMGIVGVEMD